MPRVIAGCDVGGTFTDAVVVDLRTGARAIAKTPTTPADPSDGVAMSISRAVKRLGAAPRDVELVLHATTTATNAVLEGKLARVALVTNQGMEDLIEIGRQDRPSLYDLDVTRPPALVPREARFGVPGRLDAGGREVEPLAPAAVGRIAKQLAAHAPEAVAICLLHAHVNAAHERGVAAALAGHEDLACPLVASHEVSPEHREVERFSTTILNAGLVPRMKRYLERLDERLGAADIRAPVRVLDSAGGLLGAREAARLPVRAVLSGPAGGAAACHFAARELGLDALLGVDMGGTSTDVTLVLGGAPTQRWDVTVGGYPLQVPAADIHTVGAGGGSVAWVDDAGGLRVGPESAGAEPGPACYARGGTQATVTDANVVLGRIPASALLGGELRIDPQRARAALAGLGRRADLGPEAAARGVLEIASANALRGIRVLTARHAADPRALALFAFGGAGPLFGCEWAEELGISRVVVPSGAGVTSAQGLLAAPPRVERARTVLVPLTARSWRKTRARFTALDRQARAALGRGDARVERLVSARYLGQSHELTIPVPPGDARALRRALDAAHESRFGYALPDAAVEIVTLRSRASSRPALSPKRAAGGAGRTRRRRAPPVGESHVLFLGRARPAPTKVYDRAALAPGAALSGPAIVLSEDSTTVMPPGWKGRVDAHGHLLLARPRRGP